LRAEFTRAQLMPRITSNWSAAVADGPRGASPASFTEAVIGARQRVRRASTPSARSSRPSGGCLLFPERPRGGRKTRGTALAAAFAKVVLAARSRSPARHYGLRDEVRGQRGGVRTCSPTTPSSWWGCSNEP